MVSLPTTTFRDELTPRYDFAARPGMPPVSIYWYHHGGGDAYTPPGMPGSRWAEYKLPDPYLQRSPGVGSGSNHSAHARDWVRACKGGAPACSNFSIAEPYTEWLVLGAAAIHYEGKLLWNNAKGEFTNKQEATKWIKPSYRKGWDVKL